jgi:RecA-family ATPase
MSSADTAALPLPVLRAAQLDDAATQPRWLVENLWAASGVGVIGGTPKSLKTWVGLDLAVSVATGTPCLGCFPVHQHGPVLIYLAEDRLCAVRERLDSLVTHRRCSLEQLDVHVITSPSLSLDVEPDVRRLDATVAALRPKMLLLDPFVRLVRSADENSAQDVAGILAVLREIQRRHDVAVVVTHHTRKNGRASQHGQALRGSGDFHAWLDSALYLTHEREVLRLSVEHRAAPAPDSVLVRLVGDPPHVAVVEPGDVQTERVSLDNRVIDALTASPTPMRREQLRQALAVNNARLGETLTRLERAASVRRTPAGWCA